MSKKLKKRKVEVIWEDKKGNEHSTFVSAFSEEEAVFKVKQKKKNFDNLVATGFIGE